MENALKYSLVTPLDLPEIAKLQPPTWGNIMPAANWYIKIPYAYFIKAQFEDTVVGCGAVLFHKNSAWLATIIVSDNYRNKGIGKSITAHLIETATKQTPTIYLIATKLGLPLYQKLGFKPNEEYVFFLPHKLNLPINPNIKAFTPEHKEVVLAMDRKFSGEERAILLGPKLNDGFVYLNNVVIEGFCIPSLGEGLTWANTEEAGLALLNMRLQETKGTCLPKSNEVAIAFLLEQGFQQNTSFEGTKMYLNQQPIWSPKNQYGRVGGNLG